MCEGNEVMIVFASTLGEIALLLPALLQQRIDSWRYLVALRARHQYFFCERLNYIPLSGLLASIGCAAFKLEIARILMGFAAADVALANGLRFERIPGINCEKLG